MSVDPLAEQTFDAYGYCYNNPVNLVDPDGRSAKWIVGTDGEKVTYSRNSDGTLKWSSNASLDTQRIGNAMALTPEGSARLKDLRDSDIKVNLVYSKEMRKETKDGQTSYTYGETVQGNFDEKANYARKVNSDGTFGISEATITIYEGSIIEATKEGSGSRLEGLSLEGAVGAIAGHETVHGTDKVEIHKDIQAQQSGKVRHDREDKPLKIEKTIINQLDD